MFKRKVYDELLRWKKLSQGKTAALIEGARRIGKSTIAQAFAETEYDDYLLLDFSIESEDIKQNFKENIGDLDAFFRTLFLLKGKNLPANNAVIIFDEVQLFPLARQSIKALVADGRYDYIETGSLISIKKNVQDILIPSEEYRIKMYPMDFEEFLWAQKDNVTAPAIREAFDTMKPLSDAIHRKILKSFRTYIAIGGMPQAITAFVEGQTFDQIDLIKRTIVALYEEDINKYGSRSDLALRIFKSIPDQLTHHNSRFKMSTLGKDTRYPNIAGSLEFLCNSMVVNECKNIATPDILLDMHSDNSNFKLFMADTGLLVTQAMKCGLYSEESLYKKLIVDKLSTNLGMIMENAVGQMLAANGHPLRFHEFKFQPKDSNREKAYELDFLLVRNGKICPVEVKSSGYRAHKSLDYFFEKYTIKNTERYVLYTKNLKRENSIKYLPIYMAICL